MIRKIFLYRLKRFEASRSREREKLFPSQSLGYDFSIPVALHSSGDGGGVSGNS